MNRQNQILAGILAVQLVLMLVVFWPETSVAQGEPLFGELESGQILALTISDGEQSQHLERSPDGWVLPDAGDFPAQEDKIDGLLEPVVALEGDRLVTRTAGSHERLGVAGESYERLVEFELADGGQHKLYIGTSPRYQVSHVRADDRDEVYLALGLSASDAGVTPAAWIDTTYFQVSSDQIQNLTLVNGNGRFSFEKTGEGTWTMAELPPGETLAENNVRSLVTRVSNLRMLRPLGQEEQASYKLEEPNAVITIETADETGETKTYIVRIGASLQEDDSGYVVKSATSPYYVLMAEYTVSDILERTMADFIQPPPTPEPTPQP
jgi:hypothetical protein